MSITASAILATMEAFPLLPNKTVNNTSETMQDNLKRLSCMVSDVLFQILIRWQRQKFDELVVGDDRIQDFGGCFEGAFLELRITDG
jgi:hypothetical protein